MHLYAIGDIHGHLGLLKAAHDLIADDMARHGVNVFPRTIIPPGRVDAAGKLTIDWTVLDGELDEFVNAWLRAGCPAKRKAGIKDEEE